MGNAHKIINNGVASQSQQTLKTNKTVSKNFNQFRGNGDPNMSTAAQKSFATHLESQNKMRLGGSHIPRSAKK